MDWLFNHLKTNFYVQKLSYTFNYIIVCVVDASAASEIM